MNKSHKNILAAILVVLVLSGLVAAATTVVSDTSITTDRLYTDDVSEQTAGAGITVDGVLIMDGTIAGTYLPDAVMRSLYDPYSIIFATSDNTPVALTVAEQTLVGRITAGTIAALSAGQVRTLLNVADGADATNATNVDAAGAVMESDIPDQSFTNLLENGDFESWSAGASSAPDGWNYLQNGAGGGVARIADTQINTYVARLTKSDSGVSRISISSPYQRYKGKTVTLGVWCKSANTVTNQVGYVLYDGLAASEAHYSNSGDWEWLTFSMSINPSATTLMPYAYVLAGANATADFAGAILVEGSVCPAFSPKPLVDDGRSLVIDSATNQVTIDGTIMNAVEAGADATDATNVDAAGAVMESDIKDQSFTNLLENGDFESWSAGASSAPDGWAFQQTGTGGGVARSADERIGYYSTEITKSSTGNAFIEHTIGEYDAYKDRFMAFGVWVKSANTVADQVKIQIWDGVGSVNAYYQNSGDWEWIVASKTIESTANQVKVNCVVITGADAVAYFDGAILVEGSVCPAFSPMPLPDDGRSLVIDSATNQVTIDGTIMNAVEAGADVTDAANIASSTHGVAAKTTLVDADEFGLVDSAAANALKKMTWSDLKAALDMYFSTYYYGVSWDESANTYARTGALAGVACGSSPGNSRLPIQADMRRCTMSDAGVVQYHLDPTNSTKKVDGSAATLTGADGQVMVEIPAFYYRHTYTGTTHTWEVSAIPVSGFSLHPAFMKNGVEVAYRYIGAYEGSMWDASTSAMVPSGSIATNMYAAGDKLCSLSGEYAKTSEMRSEYRAMGTSRGTGWRQLDFDLNSAVQLLYLIEYADFDSQSMIGMGRTELSGGSWVADSYIGQCGKSNGDGDGTNSVAGNTNDAYMTYRGIENWYGNVYKWNDGININNNIPYVTNNDGVWADDTSTGYTNLSITLANANGYQLTLEQTGRVFLPASVSADATYVSDYYYQSTGWRVVRLGGYASYGAFAGAFCVAADAAASNYYVSIAARLAY